VKRFRQSLARLLRWFQLAVFSALLPVCLGILLFKGVGAVLGLVIWAIAFAYLLCGSEKRLLAAMRKEGDLQPPTQALQESYFRVQATQTGVTGARLLVSRDPSLNALVARSLFGSGIIILTQGLVSGLSEAELRSLLRAAILRSQEKGIVFESLCAAFSLALLAIFPREAVGFIFSKEARRSLGGRAAFQLALLFPAIRFLLSLSQKSYQSDSSFPGSFKSDVALQKIGRKSSLWQEAGSLRSAAGSSLYLFDPWSKPVLFPH
jgi:hypothetical protein